MSTQTLTNANTFQKSPAENPLIRLLKEHRLYGEPSSQRSGTPGGRMPFRWRFPQATAGKTGGQNYAAGAHLPRNRTADRA